MLSSQARMLISLVLEFKTLIRNNPREPEIFHLTYFT